MRPEKSKKEILDFCSKIGSDEKCVIVDLGAYIGKFTELFSTIGKNNLVVSVEPIIENFVELVNKKIDNVIPVLCGIGNKNRIDNIYLVLSKLYKSGMKIKRGWRNGDFSKRLVPIISWDNLVDMLDLEKVDFCKVNIEGMEEELIEGMTKVFPDKMIIEEHSSREVTDINHLISLLEKNYKIVKRESSDIYVEKL